MGLAGRIPLPEFFPFLFSTTENSGFQCSPSHGIQDVTERITIWQWDFYHKLFVYNMFYYSKSEPFPVVAEIGTISKKSMVEKREKRVY